jgi:2-haloacid dehalogenase
MSNPDVRAVLFDVFGTVVDWRGSLMSDLSAWGLSRGIVADWARLADAWRGAYAPSMDAVRRGAQPWTILDDLHRASLERLLPRFGLAGLADVDIAYISRVWHRLAPWPDAVAAALSNGNVSLLIDMAKHGGLPWDMVFGADLFGHYKPDEATYLGACRLLGLPPAQVMMAAAHAGDLAAAQRLGLRTAFIARPLEHGPGGTAEPAGAWDVSVASIEELAARLETARG